MAEVYPPGKHKIFYQPGRGVDTPSLSITVDILKPNGESYSRPLNKLEEVLDEKSSDGLKKLYYFECYFDIEGTWVGVFYEEGVEKRTQYWSIRKGPEGFRASPGNNVINIG